jgi:hypothetical protein
MLSHPRLSKNLEASGHTTRQFVVMPKSPRGFAFEASMTFAPIVGRHLWYRWHSGVQLDPPCPRLDDEATRAARNLPLSRLAHKERCMFDAIIYYAYGIAVLALEGCGSHLYLLYVLPVMLRDDSIGHLARQRLSISHQHTSVIML